MTRFQTRAFLLCFVPFAVLLTLSFSMIEKLVQSTVREGLRKSLRQNHLAMARARARSELQNSRFLRVVGENAGLKAGMQLILYEPESLAARRTVEDQLAELCRQMGFDFLMVAGSDGTPLAGVVRSGDRLVPVNAGRLGVPPQGLVVMEGHAFQMASVPVDLAEENIGSLAVGSYFDLSDLTTPAVLLRGEKVIQSGIAGVSVAELESALGVCKEKTECEVRLKGVKYLSLPLESVGPGGSATRGEYVLRSLQDVDSATGPVHAVLQRVFVSVAALALLVALIGSVATSRSIGEPLATVMSHLRETERTGVLAEFRTDLSPVQEIRELTESFNRAAVSLREARGGLEKAYVEFVGALANTLDARDPYTAGHSRRVSNLSCAMGSAAGLSAGEVQRIRIGALLHDIGKIGISDLVLRKPGRLTEDEFAVVKQHPVVGRRILEAVQGFAEFLPAVELHHENWNGSGYPHGQRGEETPLDARIIHVADAYDAMTTDRPYRKGMTREQAVGILRAEAGKQFDPAMVEVFTSLDGIAAGPGPAEAEAELHGVAP